MQRPYVYLLNAHSGSIQEWLLISWSMKTFSYILKQTIYFRNQYYTENWLSIRKNHILNLNTHNEYFISSLFLFINQFFKEILDTCTTLFINKKYYTSIYTQMKSSRFEILHICVCIIFRRRGVYFSKFLKQMFPGNLGSNQIIYPPPPPPPHPQNTIKNQR